MRAAAVIGLALAVLLVPPSGAAQQRKIVPKPAPGSAQVEMYKQSWAVVVGIDRFRDSAIARLNYAVNDARAVARALTAVGFPEKNIFVLENERATRQEIERVLASVLRKATGPNDRLFVFFATHGVTTPLPHGGDEGYLLPYDARPDDLPLTAYSMNQLKQVAQRIPAKHILIAVDACYGGYSLVRAQAPAIPDQRYLELIARSRVIQVLTAGRRDQPVIEEQGHGVFTSRLLEGLAGHADVNRDGLITVSELAAWMHPRVAQASEFKQDMQWGTLDGEGQFVFVLRQEPGAPAAEEARRLEAQRLRIEEERRQLEEARRLFEEEKRLREERERLEAERKRLDEERQARERERLEAEKRRLDEERRVADERQRQEAERRRAEEERRRLHAAIPREVAPDARVRYSRESVITRENALAVLRSCMPNFRSEEALDRLFSETGNFTTMYTRTDTHEYVVVRSKGQEKRATCIGLAKSGYALIPTEVLAANIDPKGADLDAKERWYEAIQAQLSQTGQAKALILYRNGNAHEVILSIPPKAASDIEYSDRFMKAGEFDRSSYPIVIAATEGFSVTTFERRNSKMIPLFKEWR